jgi:hypothetical protein
MKSPEPKLFNTYTKNQKFNGPHLQNQYIWKNQGSLLSKDFDFCPCLCEKNVSRLMKKTEAKC